MPTLQRRHRISLALFIIGLVLSGITAFPLITELRLLCSAFHLEFGWLVTVRDGLTQTYTTYPWLGYGTDWLAFAHVVIALFFIGPWLHPVRNNWVLGVGMVACAGIVPLAFIAGEVRGIPLGWRLIDCSFAVFGMIPLVYCWCLAKKMAQATPGT